MNPERLPVAYELFAQWQRARGGRTPPATRPFSRRWEDLLDDTELVSGTDRNEAERDARDLESGGWIELKSVRYKPHLIDRLVIPLAAEMRWREAFGFVQPTDEEIRRIREFDWAPPLAFLRNARLNVSFAELRRLDDFFKADARQFDLVPIKERSLEIFGEEKRLDALLTSALFRPERLDLKRDLHCEVVGEPLPWKRGSVEAAEQPLIVIENAATWHSYCRWNAEQKLFSAVVYGGGNRFVDGVRFLEEIFVELGGARNVFYFGDLDPPGLRIPQTASDRSQAAGLPVVAPHLWSYRNLLELGRGQEQLWAGESPSSTLCDWLGELAVRARSLFESNQRLAQEHVGWEFLRNQRHAG